MPNMAIKLDDIILQYAQNKAEMDSYKKIVDEENAQIKEIMLGSDIKEHISGDYKAVCSISQRETMKEDVLLDIAHANGLNNIIKTKEYIDFDALENAIYHNEISDDVLLEMDKAKEVKEVVTLRVTKLKKKKEN